MSDNTELIAEKDRWPSDSLVYQLAIALEQAERDLTELGTAFRDYKIVHPEGTEDLHRKLADQAAVIEAALKVTDDMRSGGWHIGKTVPDLGEKLYRILDTTEGTR